MRVERGVVKLCVSIAKATVNPEMELADEGGQCGVLSERVRETKVVTPRPDDDAAVQTVTSLFEPAATGEGTCAQGLAMFTVPIDLLLRDGCQDAKPDFERELRGGHL